MNIPQISNIIYPLQFFAIKDVVEKDEFFPTKESYGFN